MESKKSRLVKGSKEACDYMATLRAKRGKKTGESNTPPPPPPKQEEIIIEPPPIAPKRRSRKKITVDFNNI